MTRQRAASSSVERFPDKKEVHGPTPWPPTLMNPEAEPSAAAIRNRISFAKSTVWRTVFPNRVIDNEGSLDRAAEYLKSGGGVVFLTSHPSIEDTARLASVLGLRPEFSSRPALVPVAIHQLWIVEHVAGPLLNIEAVPVITEHSLERKKYTREEMQEHLKHFAERLVFTLGHNGIVGAAFQSDQAPKLVLPDKKLLELIIRRTDKAKIHDIGFVFMGIDIVGRDITKSRNVSVVRHPYEFTLSRLYTKDEIKKSALDRELSPDMWGYEVLRSLVPPKYRSE